MPCLYCSAPAPNSDICVKCAQRRPLFPLGQVVATPGAIDVMARIGINAAALLGRHVAGDWGDIDPEDRGLNEEALRDGTRIFSVYGPDGNDRLWIITEADVAPRRSCGPTNTEAARRFIGPASRPLTKLERWPKLSPLRSESCSADG